MLIGTFIALQSLLTLYGASLLFIDVRKSGCDPSESQHGNKACSTTGVHIFGALLGITFAAQGLSQVVSFVEAVSAARAACYPAMQAIKRTVGSELGKEREIVMPKKQDGTDEAQKDIEKKPVLRKSSRSFFRRSTATKDGENVHDKKKLGDEETGLSGTSDTTAILPKYEIDSSSEGGTKTPIANGSIQFKDVVFAYP